VYTLIPSDTAPQGLLLPLLDCYSPLCIAGLSNGCYAPTCPNSAKNSAKLMQSPRNSIINVKNNKKQCMILYVITLLLLDRFTKKYISDFIIGIVDRYCMLCIICKKIKKDSQILTHFLVCFKGMVSEYTTRNTPKNIYQGN
jgi:hypothetical protein